MFKSIWISIAYNFNKGVDVEKELGTTALVRVLQRNVTYNMQLEWVRLSMLT